MTTRSRPFLRSAANYDTNQASRESGLKCLDASRAIQSQRDEADINSIVKRFGITGTLPQAAKPPVYENFEDVFDFASAMDAINQANRAFMSYPAKTRAYFSNNPQEMVEFCSDPKNLPEMRRLGLASPEASPEPTPAP